MPGEEASHQLVVAVDGTPLSDEAAAMLTSGYVDDSTNVPDLFVLRFSDDHAKVLTVARIRIGSTVRLSVQSSGPGGPKPLLEGEVTALETEVDVDGVHVVVRGLDKSHRLFHGRRVEAYLKMTASDVAKKVASRAGLGLGEVTSVNDVVEHVSQQGVSDWELLQRLADESGRQVGVVDGRLVFRKRTAANGAPSSGSDARTNPLVIEKGVNLVSLRACVTSGDQVPQVQVRSWDVATKKALVGNAAAATSSAALDLQPQRLATTFASPDWLEPMARLDTQSQCQSAATALADRIGGSFAELEGVVRGNPAMRAGAAVAVKGVGAPFDGRYTLTSTRHEFTHELGYLTYLTVSNASDRSMYGLTGSEGAATAPVRGVLPAIVTSNRDPENRGRVKVAFPVLSDSYESAWARTLQMGAGKGRGWVVLPEVNDEVLVAFGLDDLDDPYVLGGLYNGKDTPDKPWGQHAGGADGTVVRRAFASRSGLVLEMLESSSEQKLTISSNAGAQRVTLTQTGSKGIEIVSEGPVSVTAKQNVEISTSTGDVSIKGKKVTIESSTDLELKGVNVKATAQANAEVSGAMAKVAGSATVELSGGAMATVKGAMVRIN